MPDKPATNTYQPGLYDLKALLRAKADGEEAALIPQPLDIHEPIFLTRHHGEGDVLRHLLQIEERHDAGEISDWYAEHFYFPAGDDGEIGAALKYRGCQKANCATFRMIFDCRRSRK